MTVCDHHGQQAFSKTPALNIKYKVLCEYMHVSGNVGPVVLCQIVDLNLVLSLQSIHRNCVPATLKPYKGCMAQLLLLKSSCYVRV